LDDDFLKQYEHIPLIAQTYQTIDKFLPYCTDGKTICTTDWIGKTIRNLNMLCRTAPIKKPLIAISGGNHLADYQCPDYTTLLEMLLVNGKDVVVLQLSPDKFDLYKTKKQQEKMTSRLTDEMRSHLHHVTYIKTEWNRRFNTQTIGDMMAAQRS
jgi:hypothetical protein